MYGRNTYDDLQVIELAHPVDLRALHRVAPERFPFLLQSTASGPVLGRYDILFAFPGEALEMDASGGLKGPAGSSASFLGALDDWWRNEYCPLDESDLPFKGGWFVYLGYELAAEIEPVLDLHADDLLPTAFAVSRSSKDADRRGHTWRRPPPPVTLESFRPARCGPEP